MSQDSPIETVVCEGRAFFVGDIHGEYQQLQRALNHLGFEPSRGDQLFSVGDLIDRGPDSIRCLELLNQSWFHAILGNHEAMMIEALTGSNERSSHWYKVGGSWFSDLDDKQQQQLKQRYLPRLQSLPIALEVQLPNEQLTIAMVHADLPLDDWQEFKQQYHSLPTEQQQECLWSRNTLKAIDRGKTPMPFTGADALIMGHTPLPMFRSFGKRVWLDTGAGYASGSLTVLSSQHICNLLLR
ncbi:metallophosphoesterase [Ferrimonas senticii]|uniref:metallophosphoesterase n=1 Tax=Ferrimonas senticii TaxID=394566 RepID=UPI0004118597|nr:metallophosphoesterase [Ferrimonas senticii]